MNLHKTHPEAHDAWLYAMGIDVRWRHKSGLGAQDEAVTELTLPQPIAQARYWLVTTDGSGALSAAESYVLAGMLWAIHADVRDVVFSAIAPNAHADETVRAVSTTLAAWPQLHVLDVSLALLSGVRASLPTILAHYPNLHMVLLGENEVSAEHERLLRLPSLRAMQADALQKQRAWLALKSLRMAPH